MQKIKAYKPKNPYPKNMSTYSQVSRPKTGKSSLREENVKRFK
jgi:hypothetical protein